MYDHRTAPMLLVKIPHLAFVAFNALCALWLMSPDRLLELKEIVGIAAIVISVGIQLWKAWQERVIKREIEEIKLRSQQFEAERQEFRQQIRGEVAEIKKQVSNEEAS